MEAECERPGGAGRVVVHRPGALVATRGSAAYGVITSAFLALNRTLHSTLPHSSRSRGPRAEPVGDERAELRHCLLQHREVAGIGKKLDLVVAIRQRLGLRAVIPTLLLLAVACEDGVFFGEYQHYGNIHFAQSGLIDWKLGRARH